MHNAHSLAAYVEPSGRAGRNGGVSSSPNPTPSPSRNPTNPERRLTREVGEHGRRRRLHDDRRHEALRQCRVQRRREHRVWPLRAPGRRRLHRLRPEQPTSIPRLSNLSNRTGLTASLRSSG
jgi:hypothetical protein